MRHCIEKLLLVGWLSVSFLLSGMGISHSASIEMEGDYVYTGVSDDGTLGVGGSTSPGIVYNPDGSGFVPMPEADFLTPGVPWELFAITTDQTGTLRNNNAVGYNISGVLTDRSGVDYDSAVNWTGTYHSFFTITTDYFFDDDEEEIHMRTTVTALSDLTNVYFLRSIDPDQDKNTYDVAETLNSRGFDANGDGDFDDPGDLRPEDFVYAEGRYTGLTIGLYSDSSVAHDTGITSTWSENPVDYLGTDTGDGDHAIGISFILGDLSAGESISFDYSYVLGSTLGGTSPTNPVPEPTSMLLLFTGLVALWGGSKCIKK